MHNDVFEKSIGDCLMKIIIILYKLVHMAHKLSIIKLIVNV